MFLNHIVMHLGEIRIIQQNPIVIILQYIVLYLHMMGIINIDCLVIIVFNRVGDYSVIIRIGSYVNPVFLIVCDSIVVDQSIGMELDTIPAITLDS